MDIVGSNFRNVAINIINHRETNLVLSSLIIFSSIYVTFVSVLRRPFIHPLISSSAYNETLSPTEHVDYAYSTMSFVILWLCAIIFGRILSYAKLPALLGVLLVGIAFKNIPFLADLLLLDEGITEVLRKSAFTVILVRAAMGFDMGLFRKANGVIFRLGIVSTLVEIIAIVLAAHFIFNVNVGMAILLGFVLAASASAIILPTLSQLMEQGYGVESLFCDVFQSVVPLDNLLCICSFNVALAIVFAANISSEIGVMFAESAVGIIGGLVGGLVLWWLPRCDMYHTHFIRTVMLLSVSLALLFGSRAINCQSAGVFATTVLTIIALSRWRIDNRCKAEKEEEVFALLFELFSMPVMFALIGYDFEIAKLEMKMVLEGFAIAGIGMLIRLIFAFLLSFCAGLTLAEQALISVVLLSKATIQAALPPQIVDACLETANEDSAVMIRTVCVFAIIVTAPIGQLLLILLGPSALHMRNTRQIHSNGSANKRHIATDSNDSLPDHYL
ncbi:Mitochondrial sodium/hydrogen exchanger 9B2 [Toxocara canis]|uniref:Mitochondrial sodium/hydrogen exchanger 9B2 n=1 Tax=Toxocara canis TaxID=6265 RepID=A0A0B2UUE6_TOXCA|nr:Mitochondrial sodium/hydrogen exchanger 9B2 [Toxocara canis]